MYVVSTYEYYYVILILKLKSSTFTLNMTRTTNSSSVLPYDCMDFMSVVFINVQNLQP